MADEAIVNGVSDPEVEDPHPADQRGVASEVNDLPLKLKLLELEKFNLLRENDETKERVGQLMAEIEKLRSGEGEVRAMLEKMKREVELAEDGKRAMESIVKRAADLEIEVSRLRHELNDADGTSEGSVVEEKNQRIEGLEREVEGFKNGRAESDIKVRELERKIAALEVRESEVGSEKVRAEMELRGKVEEKEREISGLKEEIAMLMSELQSSKDEKKAAEDASKKSKEKAKEMESKLQWPVVAAGSTGAIVVAAAVAYVCYGRRQS
ncbi:peroxisomal and mitochondrial division factor 1 isoform X2 [Rhodamnia argentea]|uniref:Peroxisomal and mitochondrial division factor 1 isoform X2 n=1 Tax=Rhodamnia argentea TaxID=178133 RepID=A0ABM3GTQ2_9MYRT|nr:peroxisomal and mitochondrial division factor 1 isoform X2 [Rhodamnia argentea]